MPWNQKRKHMRPITQILAVDPGPVQSAFAFMDKDFNPLKVEKSENNLIRNAILLFEYDALVIEEAVGRKWSGKEVSETAFQAGTMAAISNAPVYLITASKRRWHICREKKSNDSTVITSLIRRFAPEAYKAWIDEEITRNTMIDRSKDLFFKDFIGDIWQAYALGVTFLDLIKGGKHDSIKTF